jgi:hypothetical protein
VVLLATGVVVVLAGLAMGRLPAPFSDPWGVTTLGLLLVVVSDALGFWGRTRGEAP